MDSNLKSANSSDTATVLTGHVGVDDKHDDDYLYLPFEVPPGITRITVEYDYSRSSMTRSRAGDETVLDLGVFCPGSGSTAPGEFRGWSGGARSGFFITREEATPGYIPGPIPSGTWHVVLGLYMIATTGCDYTVTITLSTDLSAGAGAGARAGVPGAPDAPDEQARRSAQPAHRVDAAAEDGAGEQARSWYIGDLQSHTFHSDAKASPAEIARVASDRGLDFLAVTDHNTISHHDELRRLSTDDLLLIPGMEITTYYGHANAWGLTEWVDFRCRSAADIPKRILAVHDQNALISVNHPNADCAWSYGWVEGLDSIEVWHALWNEGNAASVKWWDELLSSGVRVTGVGGSDRHEPAHYDPYFPHQVGTPATRVFADQLSTQAILDGIRSGRVTISASPAGPWVELTVVGRNGSVAGPGEELRVGEGHKILVQCLVHDAEEHVVELVSNGAVINRRALEPGENKLEFAVTLQGNVYVRAQVVSRATESQKEARQPRTCALCNPVYLVGADKSEGAERNRR